MNYSDWMRKRWYVLLICVALGAGLTSVTLQIYYYPLATYSSFIGGLLGLGLTYLIYKVDRPAE
jgi:phosphate/sulfate permease